MGTFFNWLNRTTGRDIKPPSAAEILRTRDVWEPMYPEVARPPNEGSTLAGTVQNSFREESGDGWVDAPGTSHIEKMHFVYGGDPADRMEANKPSQRRFVKLFLNNESIITVRFRDTETGQVQGEYAYYFTDHKFALDVWEDLISSPHPYGEVLYPRVIKPRQVTYKALWKR